MPDHELVPDGTCRGARGTGTKGILVNWPGGPRLSESGDSRGSPPRHVGWRWNHGGHASSSHRCAASGRAEHRAAHPCDASETCGPRPARPTSVALIGELRSIIPGLVGVVGDTSLTTEIARQVHQAGFPTVLFTDEPVLPPVGVGIHPITDPGPPMEVAESALELVGNTPLVRLDRIGKTSRARSWPSSSTSTPGEA